MRGSVEVLNPQEKPQVSQQEQSQEGFWSLVLKKHSSNELSRLLTAWVQDSLRPADDRSYASEPPLQTEDSGKGNDAIKAAGGTPDASYAKYAYHKQEIVGTPRKDSPYDVMATCDDMGKGGPAPQASVHGPPPPPNPPPDAERMSQMTSQTDLSVGETPSTAVVFHGEREFAEPRAARHAEPAPEPTASAPRSPGPTTAAAQTPTSPVTARRQRSAPLLSEAHAAVGSSVAPAPHAAQRNVNICFECQQEFTGPSFMLNDRSYCCQRHRLLAYHKFERGQIDHPGFRSTDEPDRLLASGVRASFRAWI